MNFDILDMYLSKNIYIFFLLTGIHLQCSKINFMACVQTSLCIMKPK